MQDISSKPHEKHKENKDQDVHDGSWWEATRIIGERKNEYKVSWAGIDPETGKTYKPCWVRKSDCTEELLNTWIKNHKQRKTKKTTNIGKKRLVEGLDKQKNKKKKGKNSFYDKCGSSVSEKKHKNVFMNENKEPYTHHSSASVLDTMDALDTFDSSLSSTVYSQNRSYFKPFESLEYTLDLSELGDSSSIAFKKSEDLKTFDSTLGTYHTSPMKTSLSSINADTQIKDVLDTAINDISMSRIFNFSESPKKILNIENDNDQGRFLEDTVSSIYHITNDNNTKPLNFHMGMFSKSDSIFIADNNVPNISVDKHDDRIDKNDKEIDVLKASEYGKENPLKGIHYDSISVNYSSQQLRSPLPSEKVSTWLSHNESMQLEIFDDSHIQTSTSTMNIHEDVSGSIEYNCPTTCISRGSELSGTEKDNISVKSKISDAKVSTKSESSISTAYTSDSFLISLRSIQNKPHVYFFGIEMNKIQRELYLQLILQYNDLIQEFCSLPSPDKTFIKKVHRFINILTMLTIHPYLIFKSKIPNETFEEIKLEHLLCFSPKFGFLACFLEKSKNLKLLIGIISDSEILLGLLEIFLQKLNILYLKINQYSEDININETMKVFLISHGKGKGKNVEVYCNLVICIYTSIHILSTRNFSNQDNEMKNYIIPITVNSIEHIQLCIKDIPQNLYFQNVVKVTILLRKFAGILPSNQFFSNESAQLVYNWIQGDYKDRWMLPIVSDLRELAITLAHKDSRLISEMQLNNLIELEEKISQHDNHLYNELYLEIQKTPSIATKSDSFDSDDKKILGNLFNQFEISHLQSNDHNSIVNDQLNYLTLNLETIQKPYSNNDGISNVKTERELMYMEINNLKNDVCKIQGKLKDTENELLNFKIACDRLQKRYEEMQEQYRCLKLEHENTVNIKDMLQKRLNDLQEDYICVKDKNSSFHEEKLKDISLDFEKQEKVPSNVMYDSVKECFEENLHLKKIIENKTSDFEFLRLQYQEASSSAANLANEVKELESENIRLRNKAEGEAIRLNEMMIQLLEKNMSKRIEELETQNSLYLKQLRLKAKDNSTRKVSIHECRSVFDTFHDIKSIPHERLGKNMNSQNSEDLNGHSVSETVMNINEF
ncbi:uncharacterized protein T551_00139 [Pneumocystis jirovecii RU7]|uniref:Chromo domain-containing protein n=1 Tax=Pneumocystis jirovecii (strain RU7) TaxID=1408657 RepID=A0A0W4ZWD5_PNEJ7|nr:uncharacterized protein T551_00139 [Pneumocystis jirovecii RU7]KTW32654.1 hypothetical protein T551_00139 [Pneumocystis jirovecii RU7]